MNKDQLRKMLVGGEPEVKDTPKTTFNPKFNVREEFPMWVKEQFGELKRHADKRTLYGELERRKTEVYEAALGVVKHGLLSTDACATARLHDGWRKFEEGFGPQGNPEKRAKSLEEFIRAIEDLSVSLGGNTHYTEAGIFLGGPRYKRGTLNAFVYRIGEESGENSEYFILEEPQDFAGNIQPILIGELTHLTETELRILRKLADSFKGPEIEFIERADRIAPEEGAPSYFSSGRDLWDTVKDYGSGVKSLLWGNYD